MTKQRKTTAKIGKEERELLEVAAKAMSNAYVLWGGKVGAAALAEDGQVYEGCNVESWVSGLGICAERCAIDHALLHGNRTIRSVAVVMEESGCEPRPCGACLQYIHDFSTTATVKVVMARTKNGKILTDSVDAKTVGELLPFAYHAK